MQIMCSKKYAIIIPAAASVYEILIACPHLRRINPIGTIAGFDLSDFDIFRNAGNKQINLKNIHHRVLCEPVKVCQFDFQRETTSFSKKTIEIQVNQDGVCQAVTFWFELYLWKDVKLSTFHDSHTNHWKQALQFFENDHPVAEGNVVNLDVVQNTNGLVFNCK